MVNHASTTAKLLSLLIALAIGVSAFGCEETPAPEPIETTTVYRTEYVTLPDDFKLSFDSLSAVGDKVIAGGYVYASDGETRIDSIAEIDTETGEMTVTPLSSGKQSNKTLYNSDGLRAEVSSVIEENTYESMTLTLYNGSKVEAEYDLAELFGIDLSRFELSLSGDGIFDIVPASRNRRLFLHSLKYRRPQAES